MWKYILAFISGAALMLLQIFSAKRNTVDEANKEIDAKTKEKADEIKKEITNSDDSKLDDELTKLGKG